jgi:hypothetical protein
MDGRFLDYVALGMLIFVILTFIYAVLYIHDIPYEIAKKRNHPHQDAIHTAGWVSLFLMHTIWPFLWIWATLYKPGRGFGLQTAPDKTVTEQNELVQRISMLEEQVSAKASDEKGEVKKLLQRIELLEEKLQGSQEA